MQEMQKLQYLPHGMGEWGYRKSAKNPNLHSPIFRRNVGENGTAAAPAKMAFWAPFGAPAGQNFDEMDTRSAPRLPLGDDSLYTWRAELVQVFKGVLEAAAEQRMSTDSWRLAAFFEPRRALSGRLCTTALDDDVCSADVSCILLKRIATFAPKLKKLALSRCLCS